VPIADRHVEYANKLAQELKEKGFRVEVDARNERMNLKIREAQLQKVPYLLVVGDREMERGTAAVRDREKGDLGPKSTEELLQLFNEQQTKYDF
jgi:threonyl-tRNA synthetase